MTPLAQILVVFQNTLANSEDPKSRNRFEIEDVLETEKIKERIQLGIKRLANHGHVLVKFGGKIFVCEKDNVNPDKDYIRREISYHPQSKHFTI